MMLCTSLQPSWQGLRLVILSAISLAGIVLLTWSYGSTPHTPLSIPSIHGLSDSTKHPIDELIAKAESEFEAILQRQVESLGEAARAYRNRRGRHPPPGFDAWYRFAAERNAVLVEDFFDRIYVDLGPFWGIDPGKIRRKAHVFSFKISVRNGTVAKDTDRARDWTKRREDPGAKERMTSWGDLIGTIAEYLPDVDIPINVQDESRLLVPWETTNDYMLESRKIMLPAKEISSSYSGLRDVDQSNYTWTPDWKGARKTWPSKHLGPRPYWSLARPACHPDSPARKMPIFNDIWSESQLPEHAASFILPKGFPRKTYHGYVQNWTIATDPCEHPHLHGLHGTFVEPYSMATSTELFPLFGGSKLAMNNDILLPGARYWSEDDSSSGDEETHGNSWSEKYDKIIWRGAATGGHNKDHNWNRFQRHRFISMLNGTQIAAAELTLRDGAEVIAGTGPSGNLRLLPSNPYHLSKQASHKLGAWVAELGDGQFTNLLCDSGGDVRNCSYTDEFFSIADQMPVSEQYSYKYLPDIDGNSYSGRYRSYLRSNSLPIKATIYKEWHDNRLWPWVHFIPMDNTFVDFYGIMEYFVGNNSIKQPSRQEDRTAETPQGSTEQSPALSPPDAATIQEQPPDLPANGASFVNHTARTHSSKPQSAPSTPSSSAHDAAASKIASAGQTWAERVLRRADMQIYVFRLMLEYARVSDDRRQRLGWADDLLAPAGHDGNHSAHG